MTGRGNSRGRPPYRGQDGHVNSPGFVASPRVATHGAASQPRPPRPFNRAPPSPMDPHYAVSNPQFVQVPMMNPPSFRLPPAHRGRGGPGRLPGGLGKQPPAPGRPVYGSNEIMSPLFMKEVPYKAAPQARPTGHPMPQLPDPKDMENFHRIMNRGHGPSMMMGQFMPMFPMGSEASRQGGAPPAGPQSHVTEPRFRRERRSISPHKRESGSAVSDDGYGGRQVSLEKVVDANRITAMAKAMLHSYTQLKNVIRRIRIAIPSIFRIRNNFKLRPDEEQMMALVEEVYRYLLVAHLQKAHKLRPPLDLQKGGAETLRVKDSLIDFVGSKENLSVVNALEMQAALENQPLHYNKKWFAVRWGNSTDGNIADPPVGASLYYIKSFSSGTSTASDSINYSVVLKAITVEMFEQHMDLINMMCNTEPAYKQAMLRCMGYYALCCDDDPFITLASSVLPALDISIQVDFYVEIAQLLDASRYRIADMYMERYFERILPMCLAIPDAAAWAPTIKLLMKTIEPLRLGVKTSNTAVSLLRTLKSWCNIFIRCEETCVKVFNKCIQLVLQAGDDSRIVIRGAATDLAVQIWLNAQGKAAVLKRIGYDTIRTLGCISGVQAIKYNIWSDLLSNEEYGNEQSGKAIPLPDLMLCRMDTQDTVSQYLHHEENVFITNMLRADPNLLRHLMNWYLLRYCKITKTLLALEKIASVIRFVLMTYPRIAREAPQHAASNIAILCCWMLNIATNCSVGSGCLELANVKMALFVDWLVFNYHYNYRIIRLCIGTDATTPCEAVLRTIGGQRKVFVKELAKCIYIMRQPDIENELHSRRISVLLGTTEVMNFVYSTAVDTFRRLLDYLLNAILHYHYEVGVVAVDVISAIFIVSVLEINKTDYTLGTLLSALKNTMLGKMCSVSDIALDNLSVYIGREEDKKTKKLLQLKSALSPIQDRYTIVASIGEKHKNPCYDDRLKAILVQCYGMILEYVINVESLNAMFYSNHLTADTLRANYELEKLERMQCPKLYPNVEILNTDQEIESDCSDDDPDTEMAVPCNDADADVLSDISSDDNRGDQKEITTDNPQIEADTVDPQVDGVRSIYNQDGDVEMAPSQQTEAVLDIPPHALRQFIHSFVHASMNNAAMNYAEEPLYTYLKMCLDTNCTPDYTIVMSPSAESPSAFKLVSQHEPEKNGDRAYRVGYMLDSMVSYLLETALQCFHDASGASNVDNILFKDWIVHIFNAFVRLLVALYMSGRISIVWELIYYVAATSVIGTDEPSEVYQVVQKKKVIAMTLYFNMIQVVEEKRMVKHNSIMHHTLAYVLKRSVGRSGTDLQLILENLMPIRFALETLLKNEFEHFGKLSALLGMILKLTPVSAIRTFVDTDYILKLNLFTNKSMDGSDLMSYVRTILAPDADDPLHPRQNIVAWQLLCRMYELAFGANKMLQTLKQDRGFLKVKSEQVVPRNMERRPYVTDMDISNPTDTNRNVVCFLGASNNHRANFMVYQRGYTFSKDLFSNDKIHILSRAMLEAFETEDTTLMQIAMFSAFPILVHSVPTKDVLSDVTQSLALVTPRQHSSPPLQFISEMILALLAHWISQYPQCLTMLDHGAQRLNEALGHLAAKYAAGRMMQFTFNGTTVKVQLENVMLLKLSV